ncbi:iron uptake porin [Synechococcales cyanobacterium C]|uniref:Iron uptake porin n=1 Tax=Petrachloros mirabilis ULC683 TaxID=2781853 RepID=A0A8K1ZZQ0_9CYAN|nr:iron uptake porin [Petrachloros mirabilis]NCJ07063.1 iron uptake porin [Petrachloros mirabilis ULC683]
MFSTARQLRWASPFLLALATLIPINSASAQVMGSDLDLGWEADSTAVDQLDLHDDSMAQVTSVSQLSDVQPTDWAFQALQSLVERYGCIAGYPDGTFRGNRSATRYELAAALNACLDNISDRFATREDLEAIRALQEEFAAELALVRGQVDSLEARTATLEAQQFSTTTKLSGEAIFTAGYAVDESGIERDRVFAAYRSRLAFDTSFSGRDRLRVRLQSGNIDNLSGPTGTNMARLGYAADTGNDVVLNKLFYSFPVGDRGRAMVHAFGGDFTDNLQTFNPYLASSGSGALSRYARYNPSLRQGGGSAGASFTYKFNDAFSVGLGYLADESESPTGPRGGFIDGSFAAIAQIAVTPVENVAFGLNYIRSNDQIGNVDLTSSTGSALTRRPFGNGVRTSADHLGFQFTASPAEFVNFSGWFGYTFSRSEAAGDNRKAEFLHWMVSAQFPGILRERDLAYVSFGQQPYIVNSTGIAALANNNGKEPDPNFHLEAGYKFPVNRNIHITPGVIVIFNAENGRLVTNLGSNNDTVIVPVIRTTFSF